MLILVLNGGSSSVKATLFEFAGDSKPTESIWHGHAEWGRHPGKAMVRVSKQSGLGLDAEIDGESRDAVDVLLGSLWTGETAVVRDAKQLDAAGHRIVHGGKQLRETCLITPEVRDTIAAMGEIALEHNRRQLDAIDAVERAGGTEVPQYAVFDTAFHRTIPIENAMYGLPYEYYEQGILRYGFHGISHGYVSRRGAEILGRDLRDLKLITCHLGNGASLAAVAGGESIDTTMGFTPLEGLVMGTRSGSVDPAIPTYLMRRRNYTPEEIDRILNKESGLRGISGVSGDMREVEAAAARGDSRAKLAFDVYIHRLCREFGGMLATLGGVDAVVFTGGVGENSAQVRKCFSERFEFLGLRIDHAMNDARPVDADIAASASRVRVVVVHTDEDHEIARECYSLHTSKARG